MATTPARKPKTATPVLSDGFPVAFQDGPAKESYPAICMFCGGRNAWVRLIEKGRGRGGYTVQCGECASTTFLCRPETVKRYRALQALLRMDGPREAYFSTLEQLTPAD